MARKKAVNINAEIKKKIGDGQAIIGTKLTIVALREGKLSKVLVTKNCPEEVKEEINYLSSLGNIEVVQLQLTNEELGTICKKPFSISVLGFKA